MFFRSSCIACLLAFSALCIPVAAAPQAQAVALSSRTDSHGPIISALGWFGELPIWRFLPQGHLFTTKDMEAIFGPRYSDSTLVYYDRCLAKDYSLDRNDAKIFRHDLGWGPYEDNSKEYADYLYPHQPDPECSLGRSQFLSERLVAVVRVASSSAIHWEGQK